VSLDGIGEKKEGQDRNGMYVLYINKNDKHRQHKIQALRKKMEIRKEERGKCQLI